MKHKGREDWNSTFNLQKAMQEHPCSLQRWLWNKPHLWVLTSCVPRLPLSWSSWLCAKIGVCVCVCARVHTRILGVGRLTSWAGNPGFDSVRDKVTHLTLGLNGRGPWPRIPWPPRMEWVSSFPMFCTTVPSHGPSHTFFPGFFIWSQGPPPSRPTSKLSRRCPHLSSVRCGLWLGSECCCHNPGFS